MNDVDEVHAKAREFIEKSGELILLDKIGMFDIINEDPLELYKEMAMAALTYVIMLDNNLMALNKSYEELWERVNA